MALLISCNKSKRNTGRAYMPDMSYSRTYETYAALDSSKFTASADELGEGKIFYNAMPVHGTVARGEMPAYSLANDTVGYANSKQIKNPLPPLSAKDYLEASRLYLINCGICHGDKLDGNGPLWKGGDGPFTTAPKDLMGADMKALPEGTMFHSVTYGKGQMGSYASQLSTKQRWMIIHYVKEKQGLTTGGAAAADSTKTAASVTDSTTKK